MAEIKRETSIQIFDQVQSYFNEEFEILLKSFREIINTTSINDELKARFFSNFAIPSKAYLHKLLTTLKKNIKDYEVKNLIDENADIEGREEEKKLFDEYKRLVEEEGRVIRRRNQLKDDILQGKKHLEVLKVMLEKLNNDKISNNEELLKEMLKNN